MKKIVILFICFLFYLSINAQTRYEYEASWFGIVADNATNQSTNLQNIIDFLPNGTTLKFGKGLYYFSAGVTLTSRKDIKFVGRDSAIFRVTDGFTLFTLTDCENVDFENFKVERTTASASTSDVFRITGGNDCDFKNIDVQYWNLGQYLASGSNIHNDIEIVGCKVENGGSNNLLFQRANNIKIERCSFINASLDGVKLNQKTSNVVVSQCYFDGCGDDNFDNFGGGTRIVVSDCVFKNGGSSFKNGGEYPNCARPDLGFITLERDSFYNAGMTVTTRYMPFLSVADSITGDGARDTFSITHNLDLAGTSNYDVTAFTSGYSPVAIDTATATSEHTILVDFTSAPAGSTKVYIVVRSDACASDFVTDTIGTGSTTFTLSHSFDTDERIDVELRRVLNYEIDTSTYYLSKESGQLVFTFPYGLSYDVEVHVREKYDGLRDLNIKSCYFTGRSIINSSASCDLNIENCHFTSDSLGGSNAFLNIRPPINETRIINNYFSGPGNSKVFTGIIVSPTPANNFEGAISNHGTILFKDNQFKGMSRAITNNAGSVTNSIYEGNEAVNLIDGSGSSGINFGSDIFRLNSGFFRRDKDNFYVTKNTPTSLSDYSFGAGSTTGLNILSGNTSRIVFDSGGKLTSGTLTDIQLTASDSVTLNASGSGLSMNGSFTRLYDGSNIPFQVNNSTQAVAFNVADNNASAFSASVQGGGQFFLHDSTDGAEVTTVGSGASGSTIQAAAPFIAKSYTHTEAGALTPVNGMIIYVSSTDATFTSIGIWAYENGAWAKL